MRLDDFCRMDFKEFAAVYDAYMEERDAVYKNGWERMRAQAWIEIQPHIDHKRVRLTPQTMMPFPWEKEHKKNPDAPKLTAAEQRARMKRIAEQLGDEMI